MMTWLRSQDRNDLTYWLGLLMLFVGLAVGVSAETALVIVGAAIAGESVITSYLAAWIGARK
jgi:hypothetical protein